MIIEMRTYKTKPGKRARFLEIFLTRSMPARSTDLEPTFSYLTMDPSPRPFPTRH